MVSRVGTLALEEATIAEMHAAYRAGTLTVHAVITACLARIAAYDKDGPYLNALITVNAHSPKLTPSMRPTRPRGPSVVRSTGFRSSSKTISTRLACR